MPKEKQTVQPKPPQMEKPAKAKTSVAAESPSPVNAPKTAPPKVKQAVAEVKTAQTPPENFAAKFRGKLKSMLTAANTKRRTRVEDNMNKIVKYAREIQKITNDDVERLIKVSDRQALRYLKKLVNQGKLIRFGVKKNTFYKPIKK